MSGMPAELGLDGIAARARAIENESYFEVLGVADGASADAVRAAWVRLAKAWHPDRLVTELHPVRAEVAKVFAYMSKAQKTLCDSEARRKYVALRNKQKSSARPREEVTGEIAQAIAAQSWDLVATLSQSLLTVNADDAEAMALVVWAGLRGGDESTKEELQEALTLLDKAVNVDRANDRAVFYRGMIYKQLGNVPLAFRDFARAMQLNPDNSDAEREVRTFAKRVRKGSMPPPAVKRSSLPPPAAKKTSIPPPAAKKASIPPPAASKKSIPPAAASKKSIPPISKRASMPPPAKEK